MNRRALLMIASAALFGLKAPLCVFACLEDSAPVAVASSEHHAGEAPCHGDSSGAPEESPSSGHVCDCASYRVVLTKAETAKASLEFAGSTPFLVPAVSLVAENRIARFWNRHKDLPTADLLLLKSTLLI